MTSPDKKNPTKQPSHKQKRSSRKEFEARITKVINLFSTGYGRRDIVQYGTSHGWGDPRNVDRYIHEANKYLKSEAKIHRSKEITRIRTRLDYLYRVALKAKDYGVARLVCKDQREMFGLDVQPEAGDLTFRIGSGKPVPLKSITVERPKPEPKPEEDKGE